MSYANLKKKTQQLFIPARANFALYLIPSLSSSSLSQGLL